MKKYVIIFYFAAVGSVLFLIACFFPSIVLNLIQVENVCSDTIHNIFIGLLSSSLILAVTSLLEYFAERKKVLLEINSTIQQAIGLFINIRRVPDIDEYLDYEILNKYRDIEHDCSGAHKEFEEYLTNTINDNYQRDVDDLREQMDKAIANSSDDFCVIGIKNKMLNLDISKLKEKREKLSEEWQENSEIRYDYFETACEEFDKRFVKNIQNYYKNLVLDGAHSKNDEPKPISIDYKDLLKTTFDEYFKSKDIRSSRESICNNLNSIIQPYVKIENWYYGNNFNSLSESLFFITPFIGKSHKEFLEKEIFGFINSLCLLISERVYKCRIPRGDCARSMGVYEGCNEYIFKAHVKKLIDMYQYIVYHRKSKEILKEDKNKPGLFHYRYLDNRVLKCLRKAHQYVFKLIKFEKTADAKGDLTSLVEDLKKKNPV